MQLQLGIVSNKLVSNRITLNNNTIHHIQHWLIFHKLRVIDGADGPAPTQPLSRVNEI